MVSERLGKHNSIKCISFSACTLLKLNPAALQLCGLRSQPQARREGSQGLGQKCTYLFFPLQGWFQRISKFRLFSPAQSEHVAKGTENPNTSVSSFMPPTASASSPTSPLGAPPSPSSQSSLSSLLRWSRKYDVFVCYSSVGKDCQEALNLVAFLEASPRGLRCFLQHRDDCPGGATSTELCQAMEDSHLWALLITPDFLHDDWCQYMMHLALAEGPMSNRIIPLYKNLPRADYPHELRFFWSINLSQNPERGYARVNMTLDTCEYG